MESRKVGGKSKRQPFPRAKNKRAMPSSRINRNSDFPYYRFSIPM